MIEYHKAADYFILLIRPLRPTNCLRADYKRSGSTCINAIDIYVTQQTATALKSPASKK